MICKLICDMVIRNITSISFTPLHKWHRFIPIHYPLPARCSPLFGLVWFSAEIAKDYYITVPP